MPSSGCQEPLDSEAVQDHEENLVWRDHLDSAERLDPRAHRVHLGLTDNPGRREVPVDPVQPALLAPRDNQDPGVSLGWLDRVEPLDLAETLDLRDNPDLVVKLVHPDLPDPGDHAVNLDCKDLQVSFVQLLWPLSGFSILSVNFDMTQC